MKIVSYFSLTTFELGWGMGGSVLSKEKSFTTWIWQEKHGVLITMYTVHLKFNDCYKGIVLFLSCDK